MARTLGTLTVDLLARTGAFVTDMGRAARVSDQTAQRIRRSAGQIGTALGVGLAGAATAAAAAIGNAINQADELSKTASRIGVTTESLSRLNFAAQLSDVSLSDLQGSLARLTRTQVEAARGNETASRAFNTFGIAITDADGNLRDTNAVLLDFAEVFQALPDGPEKSALALEVFGRSGQALIPLLNNGRDGLEAMGEEAKSLGLELSGSAGKAAEEFNDTLTRAKLALQGVALQVTQEILPNLTEFAGKLNDPQFREGFASIVSGAVTAAGAVADLLAKIANLTTLGAEGLARSLTGLSDPRDLASVREELDRITSRVEILRAIGAGTDDGVGLVNAYQAVYSTDAYAQAEGENTFLGLGFVGPEEELRLLEERVAQLTTTLNDAERAQQALAEASRAAADSTSGGAAATTDANEALARFNESLERSRNAQSDAASASRGAAEAARAAAEQEAARQRVIDAAIQSQTELNGLLRQQADAQGADSPLYAASREYADTLTELIGIEDRLREAQLLSADAQAQLAAARADAEEKLERANAAAARQTEIALKDKEKGPLQESVDQVSEYALEAARGIQGIISGALTDGFEGGAKGILKSFERLITEITAQIVAAQIAESLFGGLTGSGGKGSKGGGFDFAGLIGSFLGGFGGGFANGGVFAGGQVQAFANGGVVGSPTLFPMGGGRTGLMGEAGPEAIMPLTRGPDGKLGVRAEGGSRSTTINVTVPGNTARETAMQLAAEASRAVRRTARN